MTVAKYDNGMLELQGFQVEAVAQTLLAMSSSSMLDRDLGLCLDMLSANLRTSAEYIAEHVEWMLAVERASAARKKVHGETRT